MRVGIERAVVRVAGIGGMAEVFGAWERGEVGPGKGEVPGWGEMVRGVIEESLRGVSMEERGRMGLVVATTKGEIAEQVRWMRGERAEAVTLSGEAEKVARACGIGGPVWVVSTACSSGLVALVEGVLAVRAGEAEKMVVAAGDVADGFVREGFGALKALASGGVCRPFDKGRDGLMLGSGAAACVVSELGEGSVCEVLGFGVSNDAAHMTAPDKEARGLVRAMEGALEMAGLEAWAIDVVFAHGTGTRYNDAMEGVAVEKVFLSRGAERGRGPLVTGVKGVIGHTLGAAGLVEGLLGVEMLLRGVVPGVAGLREAERGELGVLLGTERRAVRRVMKVGSGFGGMNAAVILGAVGDGRKHEDTKARRGTKREGVGVVKGGVGKDVVAVVRGLLEGVEERGRVGLVLGTVWGCLEADRVFDRSRVEEGGRYVSPGAFSRTLPSTVAAEVALALGMTGPSVVVSAGAGSAAVALRRAAAWMEGFGLDFCVAGGVDGGVAELVLLGRVKSE